MRARHVFAAAAILALAPVLPVQPPTAWAGDEAIVVYSAGIDGILVDDKDRALREALKMMDDRVMELPGELEDPGMPAPLIRMALRMLRSPLTLRAGAVGDDGAEMWPPFFAQLTVAAQTAQVARDRALMVHQMLAGMMGEEAIADVADADGVKMIDLQGAPAYFGAVDLDGTPSFLLALNTLDPAPQPPAMLALPHGTEPGFALKIDTASIAPLIDLMLAEAPPMEADVIRSQLALSGIGGEAPISFDFACGYGADRAYAEMRYGNYAHLPTVAPVLTDQRLTRRQMAMVPADATHAGLWRINLRAMPQVMRAMLRQMPQEMEPAPVPDFDELLAMFAEHTGVDLEADIFAHLGTSMGYYTSDATGGGGLTSLVGFFELTDEQAFAASIDRLCRTANELSGENARGYVRFDTRTFGRQSVTTLHFPGLPIPLEIGLAVSDGYLWAGATPQAVLTAMDQAAGRGKSLLDNPRFIELAGTDTPDAMWMTFIDTPRMARNGYGLMSLGASALANALRSPSDASRDPGLILPPYRELMDGVKGSLAVYRMDGDDLLISTQSDRSVLVNLAAAAGIVSDSSTVAAMGAMGAGIVLPSVARAREQAKVTISMTQLRQIAMAMAMYAAEHEDRIPESIDELIEAGYLTERTFSSPFGPLKGEGGDIWVNASGGVYGEIGFPSRTIMGYDRAAYANHDKVTVLFADGHAEAMTPWDFMELMEDPIHEGIDFDLPGDW